MGGRQTKGYKASKAETEAPAKKHESGSRAEKVRAIRERYKKKAPEGNAKTQVPLEGVRREEGWSEMLPVTPPKLRRRVREEEEKEERERFERLRQWAITAIGLLPLDECAGGIGCESSLFPTESGKVEITLHYYPSLVEQPRPVLLQFMNLATALGVQISVQDEWPVCIVKQ